MLNDDELYAVLNQLVRHALPKPKKGWGPNKPTGYELRMIRKAYDIVATEFWSRAEEEQRIDKELNLIRAEYEGSE